MLFFLLINIISSLLHNIAVYSIILVVFIYSELLQKSGFLYKVLTFAVTTLLFRTIGRSVFFVRNYILLRRFFQDFDEEFCCHGSVIRSAIAAKSYAGISKMLYLGFN